MAFKFSIHTQPLLTKNTNEVSGSKTAGSTICLVKKVELAKRLSVCSREIDKWVKLQIIPYIKTGPHCIRYDVDDVVAELKKKYQVNPRNRN